MEMNEAIFLTFHSDGTLDGKRLKHVKLEYDQPEAKRYFKNKDLIFNLKFKTK